MEKDNICWQSPGYSLYLNPNDSELKFDNRNLNPNENYSGALSVFGKCLCKRKPSSAGGGGFSLWFIGASYYTTHYLSF